MVTPRLVRGSGGMLTPRLVRGSGGMLTQKIFKIRILRLAENECHTSKFSDFSLTFLIFKNSLTFSLASKFPDISRSLDTL